ncbi:MAG: glycosyltransferase family 25 protein [Balneolaceae bacterium]|nr:glycosyltransferase family 25 protein [Balneolaceae bacterium]MDR9409550.1 glycosyltransferase family 25 protein [Balneolaceae bacterium]
MDSKKRLFEILNTYFDHIYVITLKRCTKRREILNSTLEGLNYSYFWGVDGKKIDRKDLEEKGLYYSDLTRIFKKREGKKVKNLSNPQIGCALSHMYVLQDILENKYGKVLILEDDLIIDYSGASQLKNALKELPEDWELLYLGHHGANSDPGFLLKFQIQVLRFMAAFFQKFERLRFFDPDIVRCWIPRPYSEHLNLSGSHHGAYSYAVSSKGAKKILRYGLPVIFRNDNLLAELCSYEWIKSFNTKKMYFFPNYDVPSTIKDKG